MNLVGASPKKVAANWPALMASEQRMNHKRNIESMTRPELRKELFALGKKWDEFRKDAEGGGSPGEWMYERLDELQTALQKQRKKVYLP